MSTKNGDWARWILTGLVVIIGVLVSAIAATTWQKICHLETTVGRLAIEIAVTNQKVDGIDEKLDRALNIDAKVCER